MKKAVPTVLLLIAAFLSFSAIFTGESYSRLKELRTLLSRQKESNQELKATVDSLKREVTLLESDPRTLEKAARNELVLAKPDEMVFIFEQEN